MSDRHDAGTIANGDEQVVQGELLVTRLWQQLHVGGFASSPGELSVGAKANELNDYRKGWGDVLAQIGPDRLRAVGVAISRALCTGPLGDADRVVLARVVLRFGRDMPAAAEGLGCVLESHDQEDVVLWTAIDAWSRSGYAVDHVWEAWRSRARDPRTIRRLRSWQERMNDPERRAVTVPP